MTEFNECNIKYCRIFENWNLVHNFDFNISTTLSTISYTELNTALSRSTAPAVSSINAIHSRGIQLQYNNSLNSKYKSADFRDSAEDMIHWQLDSGRYDIYHQPTDLHLCLSWNWSCVNKVTIPLISQQTVFMSMQSLWWLCLCAAIAKRTVLSWQWNCRIDSDSNFSANARPFQHLGPETAKLRGP